VKARDRKVIVERKRNLEKRLDRGASHESVRRTPNARPALFSLTKRRSSRWALSAFFRDGQLQSRRKREITTGRPVLNVIVGPLILTL